jgi:hypothetical protein
MVAGVTPIFDLSSRSKLGGRSPAVFRRSLILFQITIVFADPGTLSGTPEASFYVEALQGKNEIPANITSCSDLLTGTIMGQPVVVATSGEEPCKERRNSTNPGLVQPFLSGQLVDEPAWAISVMDHAQASDRLLLLCARWRCCNVQAGYRTLYMSARLATAHRSIAFLTR